MTRAREGLYIWFPYHYGSHATFQLLGESGGNLPFPYHYGSHATSHATGTFARRPLQFPYHYGSHATETPRLQSGD